MLLHSHFPSSVVGWESRRRRAACLALDFSPDVRVAESKTAAESREAAPATPATPLVDALLRRAADGSAPFHIPGHKRGAGASPALLSVLGPVALRHDLTELDGLDYLCSPVSSIAAAQASAAAVFGAHRTFFLVNGTSGGIQAALLAVVRPGDAVVLARNCHVAALSACALAGALPFFAHAQVDEHLGVAHCVTPGAAEAALAEAASACAAAPDRPGRPRPRVAALLVVSPTYFGCVADVAGLARVAHAVGACLVIDEAHGAHFGLHAALPRSSLACGADAAVQSTHKTLGGLTQASMLHVSASRRVQPSRVRAALATLHTTSPSYLLMASLDAAAADAARAAAGAVAVATDIRRRLAASRNARRVLSSPPASAIDFDITRLTFSTAGLFSSGYAAASFFTSFCGITPELAAPGGVGFVIGSGNAGRDADALVRALGDACGDLPTPASSPHTPPSFPPAPAPLVVALSPRAALMGRREAVATSHAVGRVCAELLCPYPPGVPVAFPGARLTRDALNYLDAVRACGGAVTGGEDASGATVCVVAEEDAPPEGASLWDSRWAVI